MTSPETWDVVVVGAGPAGSAAARLLALANQRVLVLEKQTFPRFQIGESLLPVCLPVLARLGVKPHADQFVYKRGARFVSESTNQSRVFDFSKALSGCPPHAWQVDRTGFDLQLSHLAQQAGAEYRHGVAVQRFESDEDNVQLYTSSGAIRTRYLVDATGQGRLLARLHGSAVPYQGFGHAAAYTHFDDVSEETFEEIRPDHDIRIMLTRFGWGWIIPLPRQRLSVGLVTRRHGVIHDLESYIAESALIQRWTQGARRVPGKVVRNFSYRNQQSSGLRFVCIGDAACFLDPVFSSGVSLALLSATHMANLLLPALNAGSEGAPGLMAPLHARMQRGYSTFSTVIDRFYHTRFVDHFIFGDAPDDAYTAGVTSVLAGDVFRTGNRFQDMLLDSRRGSQSDARRFYGDSPETGSAPSGTGA